METKYFLLTRKWKGRTQYRKNSYTNLLFFFFIPPVSRWKRSTTNDAKRGEHVCMYLGRNGSPAET